MTIDTLPLADMQVFTQVVAHKSFAGAARQLQLTTSAVSRSIGRLEMQLGVKLLHRTTRTLSLTDVGAAIYADCLHMLAHAEQAVSRAASHRQQPQGILRINAPLVFGDYWLAPLLPDFYARWPDVQVQLGMRDSMVDLVAEGIDLAIRISTAEALPPQLVARPLMQVRYLLVAPPDYLRQHAAIETPTDLLQHPCMSLGYGPFQSHIALVPLDAPQQPPTTLRLNTPITIASSHGMLQALKHSPRAGIALVADFVAKDDLQQGHLVPVLPQWQLAASYAPRTVYAIYAPGPLIAPKLRAMLDFLQEHSTLQATR